jgi:hypothetical protein
VKVKIQDATPFAPRVEIAKKFDETCSRKSCW